MRRLGDVMLAEPGALIGFAGPRVIEQITKQKLPPGFQTRRVPAPARHDRPGRPARRAAPTARAAVAALRRPSARRGWPYRSESREPGLSAVAADRGRDSAAALSRAPCRPAPTAWERVQARPPPRAPVYARLRPPALRRLRRAARRSPVRRRPGAGRRPGQPRRPDGDGARPAEGPRHPRERAAPLRHGAARGLPQGAAPDASRPSDSAYRWSASSTRPAPTRPAVGGARPGLAIADEPGRAWRAWRRRSSPSSSAKAAAGALAIGMADRVLMLENAIYSVASPEGCASILWNDAARAAEAAEAMQITAPDLLHHEVIDAVVPEPPGGAHVDPQATAEALRGVLAGIWPNGALYGGEDGWDTTALLAERFARYRRIRRVSRCAGRLSHPTRRGCRWGSPCHGQQSERGPGGLTAGLRAASPVTPDPGCAPARGPPPRRSCARPIARAHRTRRCPPPVGAARCPGRLPGAAAACPGYPLGRHDLRHAQVRLAEGLDVDRGRPRHRRRASRRGRLRPGVTRPRVLRHLRPPAAPCCRAPDQRPYSSR